MDKTKFSVIGHRTLSICNPLGNTKIDHAIELLGLKPDAHVVDFGAGKCEVLIRMIEKYGITGIAIELADGLVSSVDQGVGTRIPREKLKVHLGDAKEYAQQLQTPLDLGVCMGASHAFGGYGPMLTTLHEHVKGGGSILVAEGYWKRKPDPKYLEFLQATENDFHTHAGNIMEAETLGFVPLWSATTNRDEWDAYEWAYSYALEMYTIENPHDPDCPELLQRIRSWRNAYLQWGRSTLGFGLYLFRKA